MELLMKNKSNNFVTFKKINIYIIWEEIKHLKNLKK